MNDLKLKKFLKVCGVLLIIIGQIHKTVQAVTREEQSTLGSRIIVTTETVSNGCTLTDLTHKIEVRLKGLVSLNARTNFNGAEYDRRMAAMNAKRRNGTISGDDKGHILASVFGGPAAIFNLVPQAVAQNRYDGNANQRMVTNWRDIEKDIECHLKVDNYYADYTVNIFYNDGGDNYCRPSAFSIKADLYTADNRKIRTIDSGKLENSGLLRVDHQ